MKIDQSIKAVTGVPQVETEARVGNNGAAGVGMSRTQEKSGGVSHLSFETQAIVERLAESEVIDQARVAAIKQAIAEGRLPIRPEAIADGILESARELIRPSKPTVQ